MQIKRSRHVKRKIAATTFAVVLVAISGYVTYAHSAGSWPFVSQQSNAQLYGSDDTSPTTNIPQSSGDQQQADSGSIESSKGGGSDESSTTPTIAPAKPTGTFVSNHHPNLSGKPAPNIMSSVCHTTQGSTCTIQFKKDGIVKSLPGKKAGYGGNVSWTWKLQDIGLTTGDWTITAISTNAEGSAQAVDALVLSVAA